MTPGRHTQAIESAVEDAHLASHPQHGPLIELCRTLAAQMDAAGSEPSTRLTAAYLSALKDLRRAVIALPPQREAPSRLAQLRDLRSRPAPSNKRAGA